jgi:hypothetical protein
MEHLAITNRIVLEKLTVPRLLKKFPAFYGTRKFFTEFTTVLTTCPYPKPDQSSPCLTPVSLVDYLI